MISQREARRLKKRVERLEGIISAQRRNWAAEYLGGVRVQSAKWDAEHRIPVAVRTARKCGHAVVVTAEDDGTVYFVALPHPAESR